MSALRVIQISDTHLSPACEAFEANFDAVAAHIRNLRPDLVIHTGDVAREGPAAPEEFDHARDRLSALGVPVLTIPGNHDVGDNPGDGGYVPATRATPERLRAFTDRFGADRFAHDAAGWRLVGLNTQLFLSDDPAEAAQWDWLEAALDTPAPIALFVHKPLFREAEDEADDVPYRYVPRAPRARLAALIRARGVRLVACGHVHQTRAHVADGVQHIWAPATAFVLPDAVQPRIGEKLCGVVDYRFAPGGALDWEVTCPNGIVDHDLSHLPSAYP